MGPSLSRIRLDEQLQLCIQSNTYAFMNAPRGTVDAFKLKEDVKICHKRYKEALIILEAQERNASEKD